MFPSPIGELHFSILQAFLLLHHLKPGFRPLSGSYISQSGGPKAWDSATVSVPYRGATFLNRVHIAVSPRAVLFPSPIGELHFSIIYRKYTAFGFFWFPSPIGELHFSIFLNLPRHTGSYRVSVPYRGATFLNVSETVLSKYSRKLFPSPIGELHFSILVLRL